MAFFQELGKKMSDVASVTVEKSKDLGQKAKTSIAISTQEREIDKLYKELGQWYFERFQNEPHADAAERVGAILACFAKIDELKAQADEEDADYTTAAPIPDPVVAGAGFCTSCGAALTEGARFCGECGAKL